MTILNRIIEQDGSIHYNFTASKSFKAINSIDKADIISARDFAYNMTFGGQGEHRATRTGGNYTRMNGEIFLNAFNGKLGEFAIKRYLEALGFEVPSVDLSVYGLGDWDTADFILNNRKLSVKTIKYFSNLLLLEKGDWNADGCYIPNLLSDGGKYDYHILVRLKGNKDLEKILKMKRKFYSTLTKEEIIALTDNYTVQFDLPGVATCDMLKQTVLANQVVRQNEYIGQSTKLQADNYYIQSGDLLPIEHFIEAIKL